MLKKHSNWRTWNFAHLIQYNQLIKVEQKDQARQADAVSSIWVT